MVVANDSAEAGFGKKCDGFFLVNTLVVADLPEQVS